MQFEPRLQEARLLRRYKRFLSDIAFPDGRITQAHCANPGSMLGVSKPGSRVLVSESDKPSRRLRYTLEAIFTNRRWVGIHPGRANSVVEEALLAGGIPELAGFRALKREPRLDDGGRSDFLLDAPVPTWVEVKYVTLASGTRARFPDAVSVRATRHVKTMQELVARGHRGVILFVTPRSDVDTVFPADDIDPEFARALRQAAGRGVEILAYRLAISRRNIRLTKPIFVNVDRLDRRESSREATPASPAERN